MVDATLTMLIEFIEFCYFCLRDESTPFDINYIKEYRNRVSGTVSGSSPTGKNDTFANHKKNQLTTTLKDAFHFSASHWSEFEVTLKCGCRSQEFREKYFYKKL